MRARIRGGRHGGAQTEVSQLKVSRGRAMRILQYIRENNLCAEIRSSIPADIRGPWVYELEKAMNILRSPGKTTLPYSNELAGCSFEIIWTIAFAIVIMMICLFIRAVYIC